MQGNNPPTPSRLIRELREEAGLTQSELARRVGTTQSVISRLESDDYEGHSLSMLSRIAEVLNRRVTVRLDPPGPDEAAVRESSPAYGAATRLVGEPDGLSASELSAFMELLARRFHEQGVTEADIEEAIRRARADSASRAFLHLRGSIKVGPGDVVADVRKARRNRGAGAFGKATP